MACARRLCASDNVFLFINIAFAMYSGALLATGARLAWDPSTYTWFRFLCAAQYRVSAVYVSAAGAWLLALVYLAAGAGAGAGAGRLRLYCGGVAALAASELCYGAWMAASLAAWWRESPRAQLARRGLELLHDLRPALLQVHHYRDVVRPVLDMLEEVEREAPNNVLVIIVFGLVGLLLQVAALVLSWRLARAAAARGAAGARGQAPPGDKGAAEDDDSEPESPRAGSWRKTANLRMYTILDKIF